MWELDHKKKLSAEELMFLNCGVGEDSWESLRLQGIQPVNPKGNQSWIFKEGLILKLKLQHFGHLMWRTDSLEKTLMLRMIEGEGDNRVWDGWMASPIPWTWVWVNSWSWWWTGRPGVLQFMGSQWVRHDWVIELKWTVPARLLGSWNSSDKKTGADCHFLLQCMKAQSESEVVHSCPTLSDPMDCSPPGSSIHGIFQARVLECSLPTLNLAQHQGLFQGVSSSNQVAKVLEFQHQPQS